MWYQNWKHFGPVGAGMLGLVKRALSPGLRGALVSIYRYLPKIEIMHGEADFFVEEQIYCKNGMFSCSRIVLDDDLITSVILIFEKE